MKPSPPLSLLLALILTVGSSSALDPTASAPSPSTEFIRSSCSTTLYPDVCYASLSSYSASVGTDPSLLARAAVSVSLSKARHMAAFLANVTGPESDPRATSAVLDCRSVFSDAVGNIKDSLGQLSRLGKGNESVRFQLSNVQTWMSAALTNEDTCVDGFEEVKEGEMKDKVCTRTARVKKVTSNALALVNSYASSVTDL